jgi:hypothetical protein
MIRFVPVTDGLTPGQVQELIRTGWVKVGRQAVRMDQQIIDPTKPMPPSGIVDVDVWMLPEPTVPASVIVEVLMQLEGATDVQAVLDAFAQGITGAPDYTTFLQGIKAAREGMPA